MKRIKRMVTKISGHRGRECYYTLCCAVNAAIRYQPNEPPMKVLCADIHMWSRKDIKSIERNLCRAVDDIWEFGDREELNALYGRIVTEKPTPKDLVCVIAEYIWIDSDEVSKYQISYF